MLENFLFTSHNMALSKEYKLLCEMESVKNVLKKGSEWMDVKSKRDEKCVGVEQK
jgi:hypothetical protein